MLDDAFFLLFFETEKRDGRMEFKGFDVENKETFCS